MSVAVLGAGAFGTALAIALARAGNSVALWARDAGTIAHMQTTGYAPRLADVALPQSVRATPDLVEAAQADILLIAVPAQALPDLLAQLPSRGNQPLVACCKGLNIATGEGPTTLIGTARPDAVPMILTGPSFAADIARGLPTALTLAGSSAEALRQVQQAVATPVLRIYTTQDVRGAELGGALKNVMAIACGVVMGQGLGDSARAALMTRGFAEMRRLAERYGAQPVTLQGLSGLGDLTLTCTSDMSRNYRYGVALAEGKALPENMTVEGAATAGAALRVGRAAGIDLPICEAVAGLVARSLTVQDAMQTLLSRPLKEEDL